jgi:DNA-binding GntR family transcriptional regulator
MSKISASYGQSTYEYILNLIMTRQLMPGERVPELRIARELGISRTPVRDAMRQLANEGLIEIFPNRFAQVAQYDPDAIQDIGVLRIAVDTMAVKLASLYGSQADFLQLRQIAQNCHDAMEAGEVKLRRKYDSDFHLKLSTISKNELLAKFQKELYMRVQFFILHHHNPADNEKKQLKQHFEIVDALMAHDEAAAVAIICDHLSSFYNMRDRFPQDFFKTMPFPMETGA